MKYLDSINLIDKNNTLLLKKQNQKKLNTGYTIMFDVKMDLEKLIKEMGGIKKLQEKTADEMFEESGYKISEEVDEKIDKYCCGIQFKKEDVVSEKYIEFYYYHKQILIYKYYLNTHEIIKGGNELDMQELKAINKKCKELGWIK